MTTSGGGVPEIEGFSELVEIGHGGFSVVYSAEQSGFGRRVAIKVLDISGADARRIEREAKALGQLGDIPNIVQAYSALATTDGRPALVMSLMEGSLGGLIKASGAQPVDDTLRHLAEIAGALDEAHRRGVHHRDIKPENILLSSAGAAHLADFGIATLDSLDPSTTTVFSLSPQHASPERLSDDERDPRAGDVYSLASTFYTALAGHPPFGTTAGGGVHGLISRVVHDPVPELAGAPLAVQEVFRRGMAKRPEDRYRSAGEFADALRLAHVDPSALPEHEATVRRSTPTGPTVARPAVDREELDTVGAHEPDSPTRRRLPILAVGAVAVLALVAGAVTFWPSAGDGASGASDAPERLAAYLEEWEDHPQEFTDCVVGKMSREVDDLDEFVTAMEAERSAGPDALPVPISEERRELLSSAEWTCGNDVFDIGNSVTVEGPATQIAVNSEHACALMGSGRVACWGSNWERIALDEEGYGPEYINHPVLTGPDDVVDLDLGGFASRCVVRSEGGAACMRLGEVTGGWGYLSAPGGTDPEPVPGVDDAVQISSGAKHVCGVQANGSVMCAGENAFGQLGDGTRNNSEVPVPVQGLGDVRQVAAGFDHSCALRSDGSVHCWGIAGKGLDWYSTPQVIGGLPPIEQLRVGQATSCGLDSAGSVWCWGNLGPMLGDPSAEGAGPVQIRTESPMIALDVGGTEACAVSARNGEVFCWGDGRPQPRKVESLFEVASVAVSPERKCALDQYGSVQCWGPLAGPPGPDRQPTRLNEPTHVEGLGDV